MGAYYIFANLIAIPKLGAATSLSIFVCSQVKRVIHTFRSFGFIDISFPYTSYCHKKLFISTFPTHTHIYIYIYTI